MSRAAFYAGLLPSEEWQIQALSELRTAERNTAAHPRSRVAARRAQIIRTEIFVQFSRYLTFAVRAFWSRQGRPGGKTGLDELRTTAICTLGRVIARCDAGMPISHPLSKWLQGELRSKANDLRNNRNRAVRVNRSFAAEAAELSRADAEGTAAKLIKKKRWQPDKVRRLRVYGKTRRDVDETIDESMFHPTPRQHPQARSSSCPAVEVRDFLALVRQIGARHLDPRQRLVLSMWARMPLFSVSEIGAVHDADGGRVSVRNLLSSALDPMRDRAIPLGEIGSALRMTRESARLILRSAVMVLRRKIPKTDLDPSLLVAFSSAGDDGPA